MALLAEELVEEWLNRQGYFTIRGIKLGVHEIDLLAVKSVGECKVKCRHLEVQASMRPVSFISSVPKHLQKGGRAAKSVKRSQEELEQGVAEWVDAKFRKPEKLALMRALWKGEWSAELVLNVIKSQGEVALIKQRGIEIIWLKDIVNSLSEDRFPIKSASGADFVDLIQMGTDAQPGPKK